MTAYLVLLGIFSGFVGGMLAGILKNALTVQGAGNGTHPKS